MDNITEKKNEIKAETIVMPENEIFKGLNSKEQNKMNEKNNILFQLKDNNLYFTQAKTYNFMDYVEKNKMLFFTHKQWKVMQDNTKHSK
jgi:hypothetical protein